MKFLKALPVLKSHAFLKREHILLPTLTHTSKPYCTAWSTTWTQAYLSFTHSWYPAIWVFPLLPCFTLPSHSRACSQHSPQLFTTQDCSGQFQLVVSDVTSLAFIRLEFSTTADIIDLLFPPWDSYFRNLMILTIFFLSLYFQILKLYPSKGLCYCFCDEDSQSCICSPVLWHILLSNQISI